MVSAANALLDRGYGKPSQHITGEGGSDFVRYFVEVPETLSNEDWQKKYGQRSPASEVFYGNPTILMQVFYSVDRQYPHSRPPHLAAGPLK